MSENDSFIDEVTDAVRRDRLFAMFRKYGWIGVLVVLVIVGGAGFTQWQADRAASRAEAFGDAILDAVDLGAPKDRLAAIAALPANEGQLAVRDLLAAAAPNEDRQAALDALTRLADDATQPQFYRDLAAFRKVMVMGRDMSLADRRAALTALDVAGRPLRVLAEEQLAYLLIEEGKKDEALKALAATYVDQEAGRDLRDRLALAIQALGGTVPDLPEAVQAPVSNG